MHHQDTETELEVICYKHTCDFVDSGYDLQLCSIYELRDVDPFTLTKFITCFEYLPINEKLAVSMDLEKFYVCKLKFEELEKIEIVSIRESVPKNTGETLH